MEYIKPSNELSHHGIKGQRWGIRRFQTRSGSLTPLGKKRRASNSKTTASKPMNKSIFKNVSKKKTSMTSKGKTSATSSKPKTLKDMTDDEIRAAIERARLEDTYRALRPQQVSWGKKVATKFINEAIVPAAVNSGKAFLEKTMKDMLGLNKTQVDGIAVLEKQVKKLELEKKLKELKEEPDAEYKALEKKQKRLDLEKKIKDLEKDPVKEESIKDIIEALTSMSDEEKQKLKEAAQIQENLNKVKPKK